MSALADSYQVTGRFKDALALYEKSLGTRKVNHGADDASTLYAMNALAWFLVTVPDVELRDPERAVELATHAAEKSPKTASYWGTVGTARYRTGEWQKAITDLEQAITLRKPDDPTNASEGFFIAMAHWQLDEKDKAHEWFAKSVGWMEKGPKDDAVLKRFRAEAAELLGIDEPKP